MNRLVWVLLIISSLFSTPVLARDTISDHSIQDALSLEKSNLGDSVAFYFGDQSHGEVVSNYGEFRSNKKTNAFGKSDQFACQWAFLTAMTSLRDRALKEGGNAVINIKSNYKNNPTKSDTTFKCGAGNIMAGVALIGTVVRIDE
jgi:uncharacterized protein YbjQ (UPF0145 family)